MLRQSMRQHLTATWRWFGSSRVAVCKKSFQPSGIGLAPPSRSRQRLSNGFRRPNVAFSTVAPNETAAAPAAALKSDVDVITTPIFYVNAAPHLGHLYTALLCDARARWSRMQGRRVLFTTGTDEHGLKIEEAAEKNGFDSPLPFCDTVAQSFETCFEEFGISHDDFVRTTEPRHLETVQALWRRLKDSGVIYMGTHCGWYCKSDESYLTEAQTVELDEDGNIVSPAGITDNQQEAGPLAQQQQLLLEQEECIQDQGELLSDGDEQAAATPSPPPPPPPPKKGVIRVSLESGHPVEYFEEENFMFKLSAFEEPLLQWLEKTLPTASVMPATRRNEVLGFVRSGLQDFSVSRPASRVRWGIPVPDQEDHMIYVWLDALTNYLTTTGGLSVLGNDVDGDDAAAAAKETQKFWPANCQVVGKDILKFHAVYWPAFLLAAGLPLPDQIVAHGHWTVDGTKMSKSIGNVVVPKDLLKSHGLDAVRYFLLRDGGLAYDGDFSETQLVARVNADLADTLGNLLSRCTAPKILPSGAISCEPSNLRLGERERSILEDLQALPRKADDHIIGGLHYPALLRDVMCCIYSANAYFSEAKPWTMLARPNKGVDGDPVGLNTVLYITAETLRVCALVLHPIVPSTADTILRRLDAPDIPDLATSGWMPDNFNEGIDQCPSFKTELFKPLHERADVQQLNVEVGAAMLFSKLSAPDQTSS